MHYIAFIDRDDGAWIVEFPDCPGCVTQADSPEELLPTAREALEGWLEAHLINGQVPPEPRVHRRAPAGKRSLRVSVDPNLAVAVQLRQARVHVGLTQAQLAKRAGVSQQQIAKLERPGANPTISTLKGVTAALERELDVEVVAAG